MALDVDFLIYENNNESGYALVGGDLQNASFPWYPVYMNLTSDETLATNIVNSLTKGPAKKDIIVWVRVWCGPYTNCACCGPYFWKECLL